LPDAARAGATFIEGFDVEQVLFEINETTGKKTATGVLGTWHSRDQHGGVHDTTRTKRKVIVKAKRVVISAGTMQSPCILMRSGLKNRHIGKNLKIHPVSTLGSIYDEEIRPWEGGILTSVVTTFENLDGQGHGVKLEATSMLPSMILPHPVWRGGLEFKLLAPRLKNMTGHISLSRDTGSGSVYIDPIDGRSRFRYNTNKIDRTHILEGLIALAKINYISGAREIFTSLPGVPHFIRPHTPSSPTCDTDGINCPTFNAWLDVLRKTGLMDPEASFMSAHQMGTVRMGSTPKLGAVDPRGQSWEADGLFVADASLFPSASGVNPMVTNMGISEWVSRGLVKGLKAGEEGKGRL
jgi:choline dehydrogenase-like flavoprotein